MLRVLVKNNLIAITVYICLWPLGIFPFVFQYEDDPVAGMEATVVMWICLTVALSLYFGAGRRFLSNTNNALTNIFSVTALAVIIILSMCLVFFGYDKNLAVYTALPLPFMVFLVYAILPLTLIAFVIFHPGYDSVELVLWLAMAILPSLAMWTGIITKRSNQNSLLDSNKYEENPKGQ